MKSYKYALAIALLSAGLPMSTVQAADNTAINIKANIVASPCTVDTTTLDIDLGDIQASTMEAAGSTSPWSALNNIHLSNCPLTTQGVQATFSGTPATNGDTNGYKNTGTDSFISVQLMDANNVYLVNGHKTGFRTIQSKSVDFPVKARLYTSAAAQPGAVAATVTVSFEYE